MEPAAQNFRTKSLIGVALGLMTLALYVPALRFDFLTYDDQQYVTENPHVRAGLTARGIAWAFGNHAGNWHPLTWISHMLDCQLYALYPWGHHMTNVLLHTANTILLFLALRGLTGGLWRSAFVAALFGWHPLHVESVAWVAERKDVLSAFFFMLTLGAYAKYVSSVEGQEVQSPKSKVQSPKFWYCSTMLFFVLGLMSKPMVVTLPFVLLLLDYWPLRRVFHTCCSSRRKEALTDSGAAEQASVEPPSVGSYKRKPGWLLLEKLPFFALAAIGCVLTIKAQSQVQAVVSAAGLPIGTRLAHVAVSYLHYIGAMFFPRHLAVFYPYETTNSVAKVIWACLVLGLISLTALGLRQRRPYLLVGWFWFLGMLVPVIGLVQVGEQAWADRYTYLPLIGLFVAAVWGIREIFQRHASVEETSTMARSGAVGTPRPTSASMVGRGVLTAPGIATVVIGVTLLGLTSIQLRYWRNTRTLFEHTAAVTHNNYMAVTLLGSLLAKEGKLDEAIAHYNLALQWKPGFPEAHFFRGNAFEQQGKLNEAIAEYKQALWFKPIEEQTHILLGAVLAKKQQYKEAADQYGAALKLNPESPVAHNNLARVLQTEGRLDEAMEHYSAALRLDPSLAQAHNNLGVLMLARGRTAEGVSELREAVRLNPGDVEKEYNLAVALSQEQQWSEGADLLAKIAEKRPGDPNTRYQCAVALSHLGRTREAMSQYASALLIQPDFPNALDGLAWILATSQNPAFRNGAQAVQMAERACALTSRRDAQKLRTLAAAYAEAGRFPEAVSTIQSTMGTATNSPSSNAWQPMLNAFKSGQPWREQETK